MGDLKDKVQKTRPGAFLYSHTGGTLSLTAASDAGSTNPTWKIILIQFDHIAVDAREVSASAQLIADILGIAEAIPEGADDDMRRLDLDHSSFLLFSPSEVPRFANIAFRVDAMRFQEIVKRLLARNIAFGNDHDDTTNSMTVDFMGGGGRIYFHDANGHLWEVAC